MKEPAHFTINPIWCGFKKPIFVVDYIPVFDEVMGSVKWMREVTAIKTRYRDLNYPKDDIRHYNPLGCFL